ncbi:MAG: Gfo/Idh/MocA family oxidoreductase [Verrucomicrobiota bacterium]
MRSAITRRKALALGAVGAAAAGYAVYQSPWMRPLGANGDVRIGVIGLRNKGGDHMKDLLDTRGVRVNALCDVDQAMLDRDVEVLKKRNHSAQTFRDIREFLEKADVDAVVVATPNHWHALAAIWSMQAGKHVYVEKPVSHTVREGEALVAAAKNYGVIAQSGTQYRSEQGMGEAVEWLKAGNLGNLQRVEAVSFHRRKPVTRRKSPGILPETLDYDLWCGPAEKETLYRTRVHYDWHWRWNTGNGDLGNMGVHDLDIARRVLGYPRHPRVIQSIGGRLGFGTDAGETPNTQLTSFQFDSVPNFPGSEPVMLTHELRNLPMKSGMDAMDHRFGVRAGTVVYCEGGFLAGPVAYDNNKKKIKKFGDYGGGGHLLNWLKAIVDQSPGSLAAPIEQGHLSSSLCHFGNISARVGGGPDLELTSPSLEEMKEHLSRNGVDLEQTPLTVGALLERDGSQFSGVTGEAASRLLTRAYRDGFELPGDLI